MRGRSTSGAEWKCDEKHGTKPDVIDIGYGRTILERRRQEADRQARISRGAWFMRCKGGGPLAGINVSLDYRVIDVWCDTEDEDNIITQYMPPLPTEEESRALLKLVREGKRRPLGRYRADYIRGGFFWEAHREMAS